MALHPSTPMLWAGQIDQWRKEVLVKRQSAETEGRSDLVRPLTLLAGGLSRTAEELRSAARRRLASRSRRVRRSEEGTRR